MAIDWKSVVLHLQKNEILLYGFRGIKADGVFLVGKDGEELQKVEDIEADKIFEQTIEEAMQADNFNGDLELYITPAMAVGLFLKGVIPFSAISNAETKFPGEGKVACSAMHIPRFNGVKKEGLRRLDIFIPASKGPVIHDIEL